MKSGIMNKREGNQTMDNPKYINKIVQASLMYYNENMTQQEISKKLCTTRQTVSKLLNEAKKKGIVEIKINNPIDNMNSLADKIVEKFKIKNAFVVPSDFQDEALNRTVVSQKATDRINKILNKDCTNIGISWGRSVYSFIQIYSALNYNFKLNIFPLVGASNEAAPYFMINEMVRIFAEKTGGKHHFTYIPVNPGSSKDYGLFSRTKAYQNTSLFWKNIDIAIVGIGSIRNKTVSSRQEYPGERELATNIMTKGVVGDICTNYFDVEGNIIKPEDYQRLISTSEQDLRSAKKVIALAGGIEKVDAIIGALKTGLIHEIITDENTSHALLKNSSENK